MSRIQYDARSFIINGKRTFLRSAAVHYFRAPKAEWEEILYQAKLAGLNTIETYFAWNFHELEEGKWDFSGDKDIEAFMSLCGEMGFWFIARPGPYICAEWDFGGLPWWLTTKEGIKLRSYNEVYLKYVDLYLDQVIPRIAKFQITKGGPVILVQIENEYESYIDEWANERRLPYDHKYMEYLRDGMKARGIDVPLITCRGGVEGAIECENFWSNPEYFVTHLREHHSKDAPLVVTEFWTGWFENWGGARSTQKKPSHLLRHTYDVVQNGFTGISHYMFYGGTNFSSWSGRTVGDDGIYMITSYDYDAPINEYNTPSKKYYASKKAMHFVQALEDELVLAEKWDVSQVIASAPFRFRGLRSGDTCILFVENTGEERITASVFIPEFGETLQVTVDEGEIVPVVLNKPLSDKIVLRSLSGRIWGLEKVAGINTLVVYGGSGQRSTLRLKVDSGFIRDDKKALSNMQIDMNTGEIILDLIHTDEIQVYDIDNLRIISVDDATIDRTWLLGDGDDVCLLIGPDIVRPRRDGSKPDMVFHASTRAWIFGLSPDMNDGWEQSPYAHGYFKDIILNVAAPIVPKIENWHMAYEDIKLGEWARCDLPKDFSSFGQAFGYLAYRTRVHSDESKNANIILTSIEDPALVYVNGKFITRVTDVWSASVEVPFQQGENEILFIVQNMGRYNFSQAIGEPKGISGHVALDGVSMDLLKDWVLQAGDEVLCENANLASILEYREQTHATKTIHINDFEQAIIVGTRLTGLKVNGEVVSERLVTPGCSRADISRYLKPGVNTIELFLNHFAGGMKRLDLYLYSQKNILRGWEMKPIAEFDAPKNWQDEIAEQNCVMPRWYRARFKWTFEHVPGRECRPKIRLTGMGKGEIWINGNSLGRFWQIGPQEDYKIPLSWLLPENELIIFDEEGRDPRGVRILV